MHSDLYIGQETSLMSIYLCICFLFYKCCYYFIPYYYVHSLLASIIQIIEGLGQKFKLFK